MSEEFPSPGRIARRLSQHKNSALPWADSPVPAVSYDDDTASFQWVENGRGNKHHLMCSVATSPCLLNATPHIEATGRLLASQVAGRQFISSPLPWATLNFLVFPSPFSTLFPAL